MYAAEIVVSEMKGASRSLFVKWYHDERKRGGQRIWSPSLRERFQVI